MMKNLKERNFILQPDVFTRALDVFVISFASWTIYCNLLVYSGADFNTLVYLCFVPVVLSGGLLYILPRLELKRLTGPLGKKKSVTPARIPWQFKLLGAAAIVAVYAWTGNYLLFWVITISFLLFIVLDGPSGAESDRQSNEGQVRRARWIVGAIAVIAVAITLVAHRPDQDDTFYLNVVVSTLDFPNNPLLLYDGMYGENGLPMLLAVYRVQSYELFVALASFLFMLEAGLFYYIIFPAVFAVYVIIAHWLALRQLSGKTALIGILLIFIVLLVWGDVHRSYGNFSFVRLFQGKSVLVSICIPAIVYYASRYASQRDLRSWLLLGLSQIMAVGFSSNGLLIAPLIAGIVLLGTCLIDRMSARTVLLGLLTSIYLIVLAILVTMGMKAANDLANVAAVVPAGVAAKEGLNIVLGQGWRAYIALFALLANPALPTYSARYRGIAGITLMIVLIVLNPMTAYLLSKFITNFSWRVFWVVPFPLIIGLAGTGLAAVSPKTGYRRLGIVGSIILALVFALAPGNWTLSSQNRTRLDFPAYKVGPGYEIAEQVVAATPPGGLVLAPWHVSSWVPLFPKHPRLVGVRPNYVEIISRGLGEPEADKRRMMLNFIEGMAGSEKRFPEVMEEIQQRRVETIVIPPYLPWRRILGEELKGLGYVRHKVKDYELWVWVQQNN